jgi:two-component system OmpR family response regulator
MIHITPPDETLNSYTMENKELLILNDKSIIIFLVDDNELSVRLMEAQFCENPNLFVKTFLTGEACLQSMYLKPDIIILDYFLDSANRKAMDGFKTLELIKEASPGTQVIMSSAHEDADTAVNCIKHGAFDYIVKDKKIFFKLKQAIKKIFGVYSKKKN